MVTREEYLQALDVVFEFHEQIRQARVESLPLTLERGDMIEYEGGGTSSRLVKGMKYKFMSFTGRNNRWVRIKFESGAIGEHPRWMFRV